MLTTHAIPDCSKFRLTLITCNTGYMGVTGWSLNSPWSTSHRACELTIIVISIEGGPLLLYDICDYLNCVLSWWPHGCNQTLISCIGCMFQFIQEIFSDMKIFWYYRVPTFWKIGEWYGMSGNFILTGMSGNFSMCQGIFLWTKCNLTAAMKGRMFD